MYNLERQLRYWHLLTRPCPCNLLPEPTSPKHEYREKLWGHPVTSSMTSSPYKNFFWHNLGRSFHMWGQIGAVFNISKFSKWPPFWARQTFFTGSYTESWIYQKDSYEHFRHFELLIDAVTQILTEIYQFQYLTYFVTWRRHQSMSSWKFIYIIVVIISWYICTGSLMMISLLVV